MTLETLQDEAEDTDSRIRTSAEQVDAIVDDLRSFGMEPDVEGLKAELGAQRAKKHHNKEGEFESAELRPATPLQSTSGHLALDGAPPSTHYNVSPLNGPRSLTPLPPPPSGSTH